jgi:uncharacterized protein involved in propanediol utilization
MDEFTNLSSASAIGSEQSCVYQTNGRHNRMPMKGICLSIGKGISIAQHGELLQGQIEDSRGQRHRFLLSLPCSVLYSKVIFAAAYDRPLTVTPHHKLKVKSVVELTLQHLRLDSVGGMITVETNIEEGKGYGSSTADCVAGALAVAEAVGRTLTEEEIAKLVVAGEIASDNFMFKHPVLFAHREGRVLENLGRSMPTLEVLGIDTDRDGEVLTLEFAPAEYTWRQVECFQTMVSALRKSIQHPDIALLGRIATASAVMNEPFLPKRMFAEIRQLAKHANALGISVAHSGTVLSLLFDPDDRLLEPNIAFVRKELEKLGITKILRFQT